MNRDQFFATLQEMQDKTRDLMGVMRSFDMEMPKRLRMFTTPSPPLNLAPVDLLQKQIEMIAEVRNLATGWERVFQGLGEPVDRPLLGEIRALKD